jgi:hypothetical protein
MDLTKNRINLITALILLFLNCILVIFDNSMGMDRYINFSIPIIALIFLYIYKDKNIYPFYSIAGFLITAFGEPDNPSGAIFFFMSMYDEKSDKNIYSNTILIVISLCLKAYLVESFSANIFSSMVAFFFIFSHMYNRFWNISNVNKEVAIKKGLSPEQIKTIDHLIQGESQTVAARKLNIERSAYSKRVKSLKDRYGVDSEFQLAISLSKDGIISVNELTNVKRE